MAVGEETCGVISMCNADTVNECLSLNLFGNSSLRHFQHVTEDTCLFLYNYSTKKIHGTWRRTAEPLWNPGSMIYGGQFPAHLPVERVCEYPPVPLAGKAAEVLGCSQTMVFDPFLTRQQVTDLCALMRDGEHAQQNGQVLINASPRIQEDATADSPIVGLLADADATVTAVQCSTAEKVSLVQERLANARALAENPHTPGPDDLRESAACLAQAMEAVRGLQASLPPNGAGPGAAPWPQSSPLGHRPPASPLEEGQICPSLVNPGLAPSPLSNGAAHNSLPSAPPGDSDGHSSEGASQQLARGMSLAGVFEDALLDVMRTPSGGKSRKMHKRKKRRETPVQDGSLDADLDQQEPSPRDAEYMMGALICACSGEQLDECYRLHRFLVPPCLASQHQRIPQGLPVFLGNNDARLLLGPFYAKETALTNAWVEVEEREPPLVVQEKDLLEVLPPELTQRWDQGFNITGPSAAELLSRFAKAAVPMRAQPYRFLATELGGVVFTCSNKTLRECLERQLFGMMQDAFVPIVQHIRPGMPIFLFNAAYRVLLGPFSATSHGGMNIEPQAFGSRGHKTPFPAQVRVMPHEPVVSIMETVYKPLLQHSLYYGASAFHFDLNREEVTVLLQLLAKHRPFGATMPFLGPLCWHPLNPPAGTAQYLMPGTAPVQHQSQPASNARLLPGPSQPSAQAPAATATEPFRFRGAQVQQFGLAPTVRLPPAHHTAAYKQQSAMGQGFASGGFAPNGFAQGLTLVSGGQLANGGLTAPFARGPAASGQPGLAQQLHGGHLGNANVNGTAAAPSAAWQDREVANGLPPAKRHRLANMAGTIDLAAAGVMDMGAQLREQSVRDASVHEAGSRQNGRAHSGWPGFGPMQLQGTSNGPVQNSQALGEELQRPEQPEPSSPFAVFARANSSVRQGSAVPFPGFAQPSAAAPRVDTAVQPPGSWPSPGVAAFPSAASTPQPSGQPHPAMRQQMPTIFQPRFTPGSQERPPPPPFWSPGATPGAAPRTGQTGPLPQQEQLRQHTAPPQQQQQPHVGNLMDSINALPHVLGALPNALLGQQAQLAAVITAALGATAQLQAALQAIMAVLEQQPAAAHVATPHAQAPAPAPAPVASPPQHATPQHATPSPEPGTFASGQQAQQPLSRALQTPEALASDQQAQQLVQPPSGAWTGFQTPAPQPQQAPWHGAFSPRPGPSDPQAAGAPEWPPAATPSFRTAPSSGVPPAAAVGQPFGSPYTPTHRGPSPFDRPALGNLPPVPDFGFATDAGMAQQQQPQAHGSEQGFTFREGEYAGEMPSYISGMGEAEDAQKKPAGVCMRIRRPKTAKKKKAAQKRKSGGLQTPASTRKALKAELRELAAEQAEAGGAAVAATPARRKSPAPRKTPKSTKARGSAKKAGSARKGAAVGALLRQLRSAARGVANEQHRPAGAKRKREADEEEEHRTLVAFDTNVFMGSAKDRNIIMECQRVWRGLDPQIHILLPRTVVNELKTLSMAPGDAQKQHDAKLGLMVLHLLVNSSTCRVQMPNELPAGRVMERLKDDGILDCLLHFAAKGHNVLLCTNDKQFITRAQAQGLDAIKPALLRGNHTYPTYKAATPKAAKKKRKQNS